jgi:hypothetical protein
MRRIPEPARARVVTYGVVGLLLATAATGTEAWPLTSFRLFSTVRTSTATGLELVAVRPDGTRSLVRFDAGNPVLATTADLLDDVADQEPERQRAMVRAWLDAAHLTPDDVDVVRVERVARTVGADLSRTEVSREVVVEVRP